MLCLALWIACSGARAGGSGAFYDPDPAQLSDGPAGSLIRYEPMAGAPDGSQAWRILYRSIGLQGQTIAVSGVAIVPPTPAPPDGRPVVAWAHPTTGVVPRCAPSLALSLFQDIPGLRALLARGTMVVATDYPGLGTQGPHPYLVGVSEGRAVLDAVRAAWRLPDAWAGRRFAIWGHSQGGHAALFAGAMASSYAPQLLLTGVAVAAPATDLKALIQRNANTDGGRNITAMTMWSWSRIYGLPMQPVLQPDATPTVDALANECVESVFDIVRRRLTGRSLTQSFLRVPQLAQQQPWKDLLAQNTPGPLPPGVPLYIVQGADDTLVEPDITSAYARRQCAATGSVEMTVLPGVGHAYVARDGAAGAVDWMMDRLAGHSAPKGCVIRDGSAAKIEALS